MKGSNEVDFADTPGPVDTEVIIGDGALSYIVTVENKCD